VLVVRHEQRVAVGRGLRGQLGGKDAGRAGAVIHDELLFQVIREPLAEKPREEVGRAPWRRRRQEAHRARRVTGDVAIALRHGGQRRARYGDTDGKRGRHAGNCAELHVFLLIGCLLWAKGYRYLY
jgi:hypothetical protein